MSDQVNPPVAPAQPAEAPVAPPVAPVAPAVEAPPVEAPPVVSEAPPVEAPAPAPVDDLTVWLEAFQSALTDKTSAVSTVDAAEAERVRKEAAMQAAVEKVGAAAANLAAINAAGRAATSGLVSAIQEAGAAAFAE